MNFSKYVEYEHEYSFHRLHEIQCWDLGVTPKGWAVTLQTAETEVCKEDNGSRMWSFWKDKTSVSSLHGQRRAAVVSDPIPKSVPQEPML